MGRGVVLRHGAAAVVAAGVFGFSSVATATTYQYAPVADSTGPLSTGGFADHALSNNGSVAFANMRDGGGYGVYRWNGSTVETVAETNTTFPGWRDILSTVGINASGQVSYLGLRAVSANEGYLGIYRGETNGSVSNVAEASVFQSSVSYQLGTDVNASGTVAYQRRVTGVSRGIYTSNGSTEQTIFVGTDTDNPGWWSINAAGHVAIAGTIGGVKGVWRGTGDGTLTPIATGSNFTDVRSIVLDDHGVVTFGATLADGTNGVYRGDGGALQTVVDSKGTGPFTSGFGRSSANNDGDVAFLGSQSGGAGAGIYFLPAGADPDTAQKVIGIGDSLFGGTVNLFMLTPRGLNDNDQVAFTYRLTNGTWGIGVASVPEPASYLAGSLLGLALLARRRRA